MNASVNINEILSPEELAACQAYFITTSNNALDDLAEPPCFRIWFRLVLLSLRRADPPKSTDCQCGVTTQALPSPPSSIATLPSASSIILRGSPGPSVGAPPAAVLPSEASATDPPRSSVKPAPSTTLSSPVSSPPAKLPTINRATKPFASKPLISPISANPTKPQIVAPPPSKSAAPAPLTTHNNTLASTSKPSIAISGQPRPRKSTSPIVKRQTSNSVGFQTAKRSSPIPASAITAKRPSVSGSRASAGPSAGATASNAAVQSTTRSTVQSAAQPKLPPTTPLAGKPSAIVPTNGNPSRTSTPSAVSRPSASSPPSQSPSTKQSVPIAPSRMGQPRSNSLPCALAPTLKPLASQSKVSINAPSTSRMAELERKFEALGDPKFPCTRHSSSTSHPAPQTTTTPQRGDAKMDLPIKTSNKRKHEDVDSYKSPGECSDEESKFRSSNGRSNNERDRESSHGGLRESQVGRNYYNEPSKRHRRDRYGDYYDGSDST
ncbi:hypothetical protein B0J17DRAFT_659382 [Rhizoctonia solani]|nr:hypothetical protein B0J17DRAFT_659382 [Rhizoctonia solani]